MAAIPQTIHAGDSVQWIEPPTDDRSQASWGSVLWLRFNAANEALTITGTAVAIGWQFEISATTSAGMDAGTWYWQRRITQASQSITVGTGSLVVEPSLAYSGSAAAFDGRSQARKDLEAVQAAIRAIISGGAVSEYMIGTRRLKKMPLPDLIMLEDRLKREVVREDRAQAIANGLGDPRKVNIRFRAPR